MKTHLLVASVLALLSLRAPPAAAQSGPPITWGADSEGGAPFEFQDPRDPSRLIGFEVELVEGIGRILGRPTKFVQNQFDGLIPGLQRSNYDMVVCGLEITSDRARVVGFSQPYYVTFLQLAVRDDTHDINSLADLHGRKIGTLKASYAQRLLESRRENVVTYDGQINAYQDMLNRRLEAVLMDHIIALYNVPPLPGLKLVGDPIGTVEYGIAVRLEDKALLQQIDRALAQMIVSGELRRIYERWGIWTPRLAERFNDRRPSTVAPTARDQYMSDRKQKRSFWDQMRQYGSYLPILGRGALVTVEISLISMILAVALGLCVALGRLYGPLPVRMLATAYIEIIRGTPLLIQLFLIFYGLPHLGIKLSPLVAAILGLGLNYSAYEAENYRAGIQSIPSQQMEAAMALGMTKAQALRHVIVPQAIRLVIPPVTNDFIALFKDSSLVSVITMVELTKAYGQLASIHYDYLGIGLLAAAMYFLIGLPFVRLARYAEGRFTPGSTPAK
jgi:polar amino acid transport system substrate-binding protein